MATSKASDGPPVQHVIHHEAPPALELLLEKHSKKILALLLALVIGICVAFVMRALHAEKLVAASQAFTDAESKDDFKQVAEDEKGTPAGGSALLMLASRHESFGEYEEARDALLEFTKEYPKHPRYQQGLFDLALMSEQLGQAEEASKYLSEVANSSSELAPLALLRQAEEMAEAGKLKEAKDAMEAIAPKHPGNAFIEHIDKRVEALEQRIVLAENPPPAPEPEPEVVPAATTPTPAPTTTTLPVETPIQLTPTTGDSTAPVPTTELPTTEVPAPPITEEPATPDANETPEQP